MTAIPVPYAPNAPTASTRRVALKLHSYERDLGFPLRREEEIVRRRVLMGAFTIAAALLLSGATTATASPLPAGSIFSINGWNPGGDALGCSTSGAVTDCSGSGATSGSGSFTVVNWNLHLDADPTVINFFALQNNLLVAQTFTITVVIPTAGSFGPPSTINGSIGGSITDTTGNGVQLTNFGTNSIYTALVDGSPVQTLLNNPQNYTAGAFGSQTFGPASFGPTVIGVGATSSIGIQVQFTLSPGDIASYTSVFTLVPEPGTLMLLAAGIAGLAHLGRRRA